MKPEAKALFKNRNTETAFRPVLASQNQQGGHCRALGLQTPASCHHRAASLPCGARESDLHKNEMCGLFGTSGEGKRWLGALHGMGAGGGERAGLGAGGTGEGGAGVEAGVGVCGSRLRPWD